MSVEFYKKFWSVVSKPMVESLNESYHVGELSSSQKQAVVNLIDKGKDRTLLKNWRPISLLNVDCKVASKAIAQRIKETLPNLIHSDQVGYVKGRNIADNIRAAVDIMQYTKSEDIDDLFVAIDPCHVCKQTTVNNGRSHFWMAKCC